MKKKNQSFKNPLKKSPPGKKKRIETLNDDFNSVYYDILNPKALNQSNENIETLMKEIEFYKVQFQAEKNINQSLSDEITQLNEMQKLAQKAKQSVNGDNENKLIQNLTLLEKKNKFLEESVFKLKSTIDRANSLFPNFFMKLQSANDNDIKKICLTEKDEEYDNIIENKNEELKKLKEENEILKGTMRDYEEVVQNLKEENEQLNIKLNEQKEKSNKENASNISDDYKNELIENNKKLKSYANIINELQKNNEKYVYQIKYYQEIVNKKDEEIQLLKKTKEERNENKNGSNGNNDLIEENKKLIEKNKDLEDNLAKNEEKIFELISLIKNAEKKMNDLAEYNTNANNKINLLNEKNIKYEQKIKELTEKIIFYENNNKNKHYEQIEKQNTEILNKNIVELNNKLRDKENIINELNIKLRDYENIINELKAVLEPPLK